jgi:hypothetical protein
MPKNIVIFLRLLPAVAEVLTILGLKIYFEWNSYAALFCGILVFFILSSFIGVILAASAANQPLNSDPSFKARFRSALIAYARSLWRRP